MTMLTFIPENVPTTQFTHTPQEHFSLTIPFFNNIAKIIKGLKYGQFWFKSQQRQEPSSLSPCPDKLWGLPSSN